jgi:hypothetical protein
MKNINLRAAVEPIKRKINEGQNITAEEMAIVHKLAHRNPSTNTIAFYAIAKRCVEQENEGEQAQA